ncbi:hypothetical protein FBUS_05786 [Fasciolopsis buskii]|uniref:G-protein coupled receptors family 1 profile domain-containing protein n=1 Tax=Fasciolopsis buskii TaxID=27845 RepID=A0A8E0RK82_9TREM|nr:hypothetical protein FBUS_05786 [Fasciolopsis buski]
MQQMPSPSSWDFADTPWDLLWQCKSVKAKWTNASEIDCIMSTLLGIWSAYIMPFICGLSLVGTAFFMIVVLLTKNLVSRQFIYMFCLFASNAATSLLFGWFWIFPAKGLPFATEGRVYLFTFYASPTACSVHRFAYSLTSTLSCNVLLVASVDRLLSVYFPMEFSNIPKRYGWYVFLITALVSLFSLIPVAGLIMWTSVGDKIICWFPQPYQYMEYYHTLISNGGVIQPLAILVINVIFFARIRKHAQQQGRLEVLSVQAKQSMQACMTLLIFSLIFVICALPQNIAYICAYTISRANPQMTAQIRLAYNVADLFWNLYFIRDVIYLIFMFRLTGICRWFAQLLRGKNHRRPFVISGTFWGQDQMTIVQ